MNPISLTPENHLESAFSHIKEKSDMLMNFFLGGFFLVGIGLAVYYDTWLIAFGVGGISLVAYYSSKYLLPESDLYQYVLSAVLGIFMAQFIYQMHGLFEMHFFAFVGSAMLITYQKWKLQIPLALVVIVHHGLFGYLQYIGYEKIYFTQLDYMSLQTFIIHGILATAIFLLCGLWAYNFKLFTNLHINQSFEIGRLQEADEKKAAIIEERERGEKELEKSFSLLEATLESTTDGIMVADYEGRIVLTNKKFAQIWNIPEFILTQKDDNKAIQFVLDQLNDPEQFLQKVNELYKNKEAVSYDILEFKDGRTIERYSQPQMIQGKSIGRVWSFRDISERKKAEEDREKMLAEMLTRNKDLEQFTYIVSHNLRSPVANILGYSDLLLTENIPAEENKEYVQAISQSVHKLDNVLKDLNYILKTKQNIHETKELIRFSQLVDDIKLSINHLLEKEEVSIETDFSEVDEFQTVKSFMHSIFFNLISNSIKYRKTNEIPVIRIKSNLKGNSILLSFKDNGLGIDMNKKGTQVFGLYKRFHPQVAEGKGLGLFMTKTQIETLGGKIGINSAVNEGTEFMLEFSA